MKKFLRGGNCAPPLDKETIMPDVKFLDNLRLLAYLGIVLWFGAFAMFFLSELKRCPEFIGKDKALRCTKKIEIRARGNIVFISLLILIFFLTRHYSISIIVVSMLVSLFLPAYFIAIYTRRFLEKSIHKEQE
jgi:hypothetical protein